MGQKSSILKLPKSVQDKLRGLYEADATLDEIHETLLDFLSELDGDWQAPSRSAIHRHRSNFQATADRMREAREMAEALGKEVGAIADDKTGALLVDMLRTIIFKVLQRNVEEESEFNPQEFMFLARSLKDVASASAIGTKEKQEIRAQARKEAAEAVQKEARKRGFDSETQRAFFNIAAGLSE